MAHTGFATPHGERLDWSAAVWAGMIAGVVFLMMEMILVATVGGESPWGPPRMMAAMVMGQEVLPPPATFDFAVVMVAMIVHFVLSIIYGFILAWAIANWTMGLGAAIAVGAVFGLALYLINFYIFTPLMFPWFAMARNMITISAHIVFGLVLGWAYVALASRRSIA
jgi:uncharacterized membrane protein YagU involved in acid resistance